MEITKDAFEFLIGFYEKDAKVDYKKIYRDAYGNECSDYSFEKSLCQWASNKAYRDVCRTIKFVNNEGADIQKIRMRKRIEVTNIIYDKLKELSTDINYDTWHKETCEEIQEYYKDFVRYKDGVDTLYIGQVQKWLNMTIKWLWIYNRVYAIDFFKPILERESELHIPLDSFIIKYLKNEYKIQITSSEWSRINDYKNIYLEYQKQLRNKLQNEIPIEWELIHWKKALNTDK